MITFWTTMDYFEHFTNYLDDLNDYFLDHGNYFNFNVVEDILKWAIFRFLFKLVFINSTIRNLNPSIYYKYYDIYIYFNAFYFYNKQLSYY
jgi:hypothetical protein